MVNRESVATRRARDEAEREVYFNPDPDPMPDVVDVSEPADANANEDVADVNVAENAPHREQEANLNFGDEDEIDVEQLCREMNIPLRHPREVNFPDELPIATPADIDTPSMPVAIQIKVSAFYLIAKLEIIH